MFEDVREFVSIQSSAVAAKREGYEAVLSLRLWSLALVQLAKLQRKNLLSVYFYHSSIASNMIICSHMHGFPSILPYRLQGIMKSFSTFYDFSFAFLLVIHLVSFRMLAC